jgi:hypothetical protein
MKKIFLLLLLQVSYHYFYAQDLSYYLPRNVSYNSKIPEPKDIIFHQPGEWHVTHDRLVNYMNAIAAARPDRVRLERMGFTYESRPQVLLIITSPANHQRLEEIRQQHLLLSDPSRSASVDIDNMPVVVWIGHSIHGNESSGSNASLLSAYYLAAAEGAAIDELLQNTVILLDPSFNPDGLQRFSTWANQHKSKNLVADPNSREFNEVWPGGRFNHYWFDLNRDWLPGIHVESQNRLKWFYQWKPNILTDHHEQGSNSTFFFQPGVPSRVNPLTPAKNQELTAKLGKFHAAFLDSIGSFYFTKENYDDFYYGKGSTFPDINGAIGILFEQASSRGHLQQTTNGLLSFPFTIRNQFVTALSTLEGARVLRKEFLQWQRDFYKQSMAEAAGLPAKAFVFGGDRDNVKEKYFVEMLLRHHINVYQFNPDVTKFIVPVNQLQSKMVRAIFEKTFTYKDSIFYDITAWTMPLAYDMPYEELNASGFKAGMLGQPITSVHLIEGMLTTSPGLAYALDWNQYNAPAFLYELLEKNLMVKVGTMPVDFGNDGNTTGYLLKRGTILITAQNEDRSRTQMYQLLDTLSKKHHVRLHSLAIGAAASGPDLGSSKFMRVTKPSVAMVTGAGVNATDAGEVWHLLDQRMNIPCSHLEPAIFNRVDLDKYNTMILVGGTYPDLNKEKLKAWVQGGGTLIVTEEAVTWASQNGISNVVLKKVKPPVDSTKRLYYGDREQIDGAQMVYGAIFGAEVDATHPLAYGYAQSLVSLFKGNKVYMEKSKNPYATPFYYGNKPLQSGWVSRENAEAIQNSAAVVVSTVGNGRVISIADNPNFRAFWLGGTKLFMNAIFFGRIIDAAAGRTE